MYRRWLFHSGFKNAREQQGVLKGIIYWGRDEAELLTILHEVVSGKIDLSRMERMATRILAIENALNGANFVEIFKFFLEK